MSFQATEWARSLPLPTQSAKFTLMVIGSYADTDGVCFPSLARLADDTVQSVASVRRRIRDFEQLGLLQRLPRWASPDGRMVVTQIGDALRPDGYRQTSDELRLNLDLSPADVAQLVGEIPEGNPVEGGGEGVTVQPSPPGTVQPSPLHSSGTAGVAPGCDPLKRNPKSSVEESPKSPSGDGVTAAPDGGEDRTTQSPIGDARPWQHSESWQRFEQAWREPILHQSICRQLWGGLSDADRAFLIDKVAPGYVAWRRSQTRPPTVCNAQKILREHDAWQSYARFAPAAPIGDAGQAPARGFVLLDSAEGKAWQALHQVLGYPAVRTEQRGEFGFVALTPMPPAVLALAKAPPVKDWPLREIGTHECGAWRKFVSRHAGRGAVMRREPVREFIEGRGWVTGDRQVEGLRAPWPFPPRKDGTLSADHNDESEG
jgi:hypothetical protein